MALEAPDPRPEPSEPGPTPVGPETAPEPPEPSPAPVEPAPVVPEVIPPAPTPEDGPEGPFRRPFSGPEAENPRPVGFRAPEEVEALTGRRPAPSRRRRTDRGVARSIAAQIVPPAPVEPALDPEPVMGDPLPTELAPVDPAPAPPVAHASPGMVAAFGMEGLVRAGLVVVEPTPAPAVAPPADPAPPAPGRSIGRPSVDRHGHPRLTQGFMRRDWRTSPPGRSARSGRA